jgi:DNA-binding CsgD family transcriptional regulator
MSAPIFASQGMTGRPCTVSWPRPPARQVFRTAGWPDAGPKPRTFRTRTSLPSSNALGKMACAASPITDAEGQLIGVLDLTCAARDFNPLMLPLVKHAVAEITAQLATGRPAIPQGSLTLRTGPDDALLPVPGWTDLTDTQRTVAELVVDGLTNRGVGAQLFLSPHTVDFHLRQI